MTQDTPTNVPGDRPQSRREPPPDQPREVVGSDPRVREPSPDDEEDVPGFSDDEQYRGQPLDSATGHQPDGDAGDEFSLSPRHAEEPLRRRIAQGLDALAGQLAPAEGTPASGRLAGWRRDAAHRLGETARRVEAGEITMEDARRAARAEVERRPLQVLAAGIGFGFLVGRALRR